MGIYGTSSMLCALYVSFYIILRTTLCGRTHYIYVTD